MAMLKSIEIKGYRSIKHATIELGKINVLIGANGSGKSNFISFFKLLNEMMAGRLQQYIGLNGRAQSVLHFGPKSTTQLEAKLTFTTNSNELSYNLGLTHSVIDSLVFSNESIVILGQINKDIGDRPVNHNFGAGHLESHLVGMAEFGDYIATVFLRMLNNCRVFQFHDTSSTSRLRAFGYINDNRWLMPDAGNLAAMLYLYRQTSPLVYKRIVSTIQKILPEFDDFVLAPSRLNANEIILEWRKKGYDYTFGPHQMSDGSIRAMALCALFLQPEDSLPSVIVLDEPELGLHPHALEILSGLMRAASEKSQVIVATQSQSFLNYFDPSEIITAECHNGQSTFQRLEPEKLREWLEDYTLGELWDRNVIGGGPLR